MKIIECEQYSPEWWEARRGIPTASSLDKIVTPKLEPSKQAQKYAFELAAEKVAGINKIQFQNEAMQRGLELEEEARKFLELKLNVDIKKVGFIVEDFESGNEFGCSPDGLVSNDIGIEIKCPSAATHVNYLLDDMALLNDYYLQCIGSLIVTKRKKWILCSYYPGLKEKIVKIEYTKPIIDKTIEAIVNFNKYKNEIIKKIQGE